jgi:hypothetical protein
MVRPSKGISVAFCQIFIREAVDRARLRRLARRRAARPSNAGIPSAPPPWLADATVNVTEVEGEEPTALAHISV